MHRRSLLHLLTTYHPDSFEEQKFKDAMITFINTHINCFERSLEHGHITASAWIINKDNTRALLMHHAKLDNWLQLGGHCDGNPNVLEVAIKESQEESGMQHLVALDGTIFDIDIHLIPATKTINAHYHYDIRFLLQVMSNEQVVQNAESKELRWIGKDINLLPTQNSSVIRMFNKWLNYK